MLAEPSNDAEESHGPEAAGETAWPLVSVVMPVRNEAGFMTLLLQQVLAQDYPTDRLEIIVADGMSDDGTRQILADFAARHPQVQVIDNPGRIVSTGLNAAVARSRGEIVVRIDGHAEVPDDFIRQGVKLLQEHPEAWSAGGPIVHAGTNRFSYAVAAAMSHRCGVGNATHRFAGHEGYCEGAQFPAIRRWVFDRIGNFDEALIRNQDDEFNYRMRLAGGKIYVSPKVRYKYYVRDRVGRLFRQYFQYGFWRIPVIRKHRRPTTLRQIVPSLFFLVMLALFIAGLAMRQPIVAFAMPAAYAAVLLGVGLSLVPRLGLATASLVPVALATLHLGYACGLLYGTWALVFRRHAWDRQGSMATLSR
jgi:succinoglycan biosynthesis protein ExoA